MQQAQKLEALENMVVIDSKDAKTNYCFCGGRYHTYKKEQALHESWQDKLEWEALLDLVVECKKPVATYEVHEANAEEGDSIEKKCKDEKVTVTRVKMCGGGHTLIMTAIPNHSLDNLLCCRKDNVKELSLPSSIGAKTVAEYTLKGFDMMIDALGDRVSVLECALLYGYPLDLAEWQAKCRATAGQE